MPERPRIAILAPWLVDTYTRSVVDGAVRTALAAGASVVCATAEPIGAAGARGSAFIAFDMVLAQPIDAFIVIASTLVQDPAYLPAFYATLGRRPVISVGICVEGYPSVTVDNEIGLRCAIEHLVDEHGRRRIAFISGPPDHPEAQARLRAYRAALSGRGLPIDPQLIVPGSFWEGSAPIALRELLDVRKVAFDALVGSTDGVAIRAMADLASRGIRVPDEVSVLGYDDGVTAALARPALSTVRQPDAELGSRAARLALDAIRGGEVPADTVLSTQPVIRRSCGCSRIAPVEALPTQAAPSLAAAQRRAEAALLALAPLARAYVDDLAQGTAGPRNMLLLVEQWLGSTSSSDTTLCSIEAALDVLRREFVPVVARDGAQAAFTAEGLLHAVHRALSTTRALEPARRTNEADRIALLLNDVSSAIVSEGHDLSSFTAELTRRLEPLPIGCTVSTVDDDGRLSVLAQLKRGTAPPALSILMPLHHGTRRIGTVLFDAPLESAPLITALQLQIASGLVRLEREQQLERLHGDQKARTAELEQAYSLLEQDVDRLIVSEKMASLGRLTAGIAHEMNSPLAAVRASLDEIIMLARELREAADDPESTPKDRDEIAAEIAETLRISGNACERLAQFLRSIKQQTRDKGKGHDVFDVVDMTRQALLLLGHDAREAECTFEVTAEPARIDILGSTARLTQVIEALAHNALAATRPKGGARIDIRIRELGEELSIEMEDLGVGIAPEDLQRVFDPLFSTRPFGEAAGLGLTIAHDIIIGDFGGTISLRSRLGEGTTVSIVIPKRQAGHGAPPRPRRSMVPPSSG
jgi:DNA-binding LacI/PurR family transcriptional regulator/signal transduction histidine kinase